MRKLLNNPWFAAVMAVAAIALVVNSFLSQGDGGGMGAFGPAESVVEGDAVATELVPTTPAGILKALPIPRAVRDPFALRPTKIAAVEKELEPDIIDIVHLSAIWTQEGKTLVLLNDQICQDGDQLGRFKIESATQDGVWVTHWKGRDFISIGGDFTLNTPAAQRSAVANSL